MTKTLVVMGLGYVGLPIAVRAVEHGYSVLGVEPDEQRRALLGNSISHVGDVSNDRLGAAISAGLKIGHTVDSGVGWDLAIIAVPTPLRDGVPDLSYVENACVTLAKSVRAGSCVILESTSYPGTTREVVAGVLSDSSNVELWNFDVGFSPERIDPGNRLFGLENTPKIVSGLTPRALDRIDAFYRSIGLETVIAQSCEAAELAKLMENTFRQVNIALVNEILVSARAMGIDPWESIELASTKPFGFMRFNPGPGVGGHCLPIDPRYLSWISAKRTGQTLRMIEVANSVNANMPQYTAHRAQQMLDSGGWKSISPRQVTLIGAAYKANSTDCRESPTFEVAKLLIEMGHSVALVDPLVAEVRAVVEGLEISPWEAEQVATSDLVIVMTLHDVIPIDELIGAAPLILDTRNALAGRDFRGETL